MMKSNQFIPMKKKNTHDHVQYLSHHEILVMILQANVITTEERNIIYCALTNYSKMDTIDEMFDCCQG